MLKDQEQLLLFDLPINYNVRPQWVPRFEPDIMDALAGLSAMEWREEIERRNNTPRYKGVE